MAVLRLGSTELFYSNRVRSAVRMLFAFLFASACAACCVAQVDSTLGGFEHVPLMYHGPDPTANYFLPGAGGFETQVVRLPSPSEELPEVTPQEFGPHYPGINQYPTTDPGGGIIGYPEPNSFWMEESNGQFGHVSDFKDGFFQKVALTGTYIDRGSLNSYGLNEVDLSATFAVPAPTRDWPMLITPAFNTRYVDGPLTPDLPSHLYETYIDFLWVPRLTDRWTAIIGVAPSLYSDFNVSENDAFRLTGKALARYDWVPDQLQFVFGVLFLNRDDIKLLPAGGAIWNPTLDRRYELIFPRPKLARRINAGPNFEDWLYLGGEIGGNTWAYDRGGVVDKVTLRGYRLLLGLERKLNGGAGYRIEVGYVISREAEFASGLPDIDADDTALVRGGVTF